MCRQHPLRSPVIWQMQTCQCCHEYLIGMQEKQSRNAGCECYSIRHMAMQRVEAHLEIVKNEGIAITLDQMAVIAIDEVCQRAINVFVSPAAPV